MRIAQVSPLWESVPPKLYGGTERIVSYLTEELVRLGHDVTLFASGDSVTSARLEPICDHALRLNTGIFIRDAPMTMLMERVGLLEPLRDAIQRGLATLATCAGMIVLARDITDGMADQHGLGLLDIDVRRNGYGRQVDSFEADLTVAGLAGGQFHGVFIRAPRIERTGAEVVVLAEHRGDPVLVRSGACVGATFHPELSGDLRLHELFLSS